MKELHFTEDLKQILKETSLSILCDIVDSSKSTDFHSIMVDETSDVSNKEQAVFCVHWTDENKSSNKYNKF